jgi:hypothetical protein
VKRPVGARSRISAIEGFDTHTALKASLTAEVANFADRTFALPS